MGLTTKHGFPYPEQADSVDVVRDIKALADRNEAVTDGIVHTFWTTTTTSVSVPLASTTGIAVTFPAGWFTRAPIAVVSATNNAVFATNSTAPTTSGMTVTLRNTSTGGALSSAASISLQVPPLVTTTALAAEPALDDVALLTYAITCETAGCSMNGVTVEIQMPEDVPLGTAMCGTCGQVAAFELVEEVAP